LFSPHATTWPVWAGETLGATADWAIKTKIAIAGSLQEQVVTFFIACSFLSLRCHVNPGFATTA
jgi:hypothetical protein